MKTVKVIVSIDGAPDHFVDCGPDDDVPVGKITGYLKAMKFAREFVEHGVWVGDTLYPPHRIMSVEVQR